MEASTTDQRDFIPIRPAASSAQSPTRSAPTLPSPRCFQAGFHRQEIDTIHGEGDIHRLDPPGAELGPLAEFQRTVIRTAGPVEEYKHLTHHLDDVRAGRFVIMVLAKRREHA